MTTSTKCPAPADLERLFLGGLPKADAETLEQHVLQCDVCLARLKQAFAAKDTLAGVLRDDVSNETAADTPIIADLIGKIAGLRNVPPVPKGASMLMFSCSACQKKLSVKPDLAGKKVKCPGCGAVVTAPAPVPAGGIEEQRTLLPDAPTKFAPSRVDPPTDPSLSKPDATQANGPTKVGLDTSLTDFLAPPQTGDELGRLGKLRILKVLGAGGMGVVFLGEDLTLRRKVAIKAMLPHLASSGSSRKRFMAEAQAAAALEHDHIVAIHQVDEDRGAPYIVMPLLKGESLDERLQRGVQIPLLEVARIGREIASGLSCAHAAKLIHRDIKPANVWLETPRDRVKILDFGLARAASQESSGLTQQGAIVGTPAFMAPEQARGEQVDSRCDLFSLGVVLYRLCTGKLPFQSKDTVSTLMEVAMHEPPAPAAINAHLPPDLSELVMKLLVKDPAKRIGTADDVILALQAIEKKLSQQRPTQETIAGTVPVRVPKATFAPKGARDGIQVMSPKKMPPRLPNEAAAPPRRRGVMLVLVAAAALFGLLTILAGTIYYWQTSNGIVSIEINDPDIVVAFDKDGPTFKGLDKQEIRVRSGEHGLRIKRGDLEFETDKFLLNRGEKVALKIVWFPQGKLQVVRNGEVFKEMAAPKEVAVVPVVPVVPRQPPGYALAFDSKGYVTLPTLKVGADQPLTMEVWAVLERPLDLSRAEDVLANSNLAGFSLGVPPAFHTPGVASENMWAFGAYSSSANSYFYAFQKKPLPRQKLVHLAGVYDGKAEIRFYVDGQLQNRAMPQNVKASIMPFRIAGTFLGRVNGIRISRAVRYDKDFTPAQRFESDKDTLGLYHFDEGAGTELKDSSGNDHHGKIIGATWVKADGSPLTSPDASGFVALFDGKTLNGWTDKDGRWKVVDGAITCTGNASYLYSKRADYADFHLRVEAKINAQGHAAVLVRGNYAFGDTFPPGYTARIMPKNNFSFPTGSISTFVTAKEPPPPPDTWFTMEVIAKGDRISVMVNGKPTAEYTDANRRWSTGHIALEHLSGITQVAFRKIEIKTLATGPIALSGAGPWSFYLTDQDPELPGRPGFPVKTFEFNATQGVGYTFTVYSTAFRPQIMTINPNNYQSVWSPSGLISPKSPGGIYKVHVMADDIKGRGLFTLKITPDTVIVNQPVGQAQMQHVVYAALPTTGFGAHIFQTGVSSDGKYFFGAGDTGTSSNVRVFETEAGKFVKSLPGPKDSFSPGFSHAQFLPGGTWIALGYLNRKEIYLKDVTAKSTKKGSKSETVSVKTLTGHTALAQDFAVSPNGKYLLSWGGNELFLWDTEEGTLHKKLVGHVGLGRGVFSASSSRVLTYGGFDKTLRLWDAATGTELKKLTGHTDGITGACLSPNGKLALSWSPDDTIRVWDLENDKEIRKLALNAGFRQGLANGAFVAGGRLIVAQSQVNKQYYVWDTLTGAQVRVINYSFYNDNNNHTITASPDGRRALAANWTDQTIRVLDLMTGLETHKIPYCSAARSFSFSPDGSVAVAGSFRQGMYIIHLSALKGAVATTPLAPPAVGKIIFSQNHHITDKDPAGPIPPAGAIFMPVKHCKVFNVNLSANRKYTIDMIRTDMGVGDNLDPYLLLRSPQGQIVAADDDSGGNLNARIVYTPSVSGQYSVLAGAFAETFGLFRLTVTEATDAAPALPAAGDNAAKLVGVWGTAAQEGPTMEFTSDGKVLFKNLKDKEVLDKVMSVFYKVNQDAIAIKKSIGARTLEEVWTIKKLTDTELHIQGTKGDTKVFQRIVAPLKTAGYTNSIGMQFALVPKGKAWLGGGNGTVGNREVDFANDFYLGTFEVTQGEWHKVMGTNPSQFFRQGREAVSVQSLSDDELKRLPVESVSWNDCQEFVKRLNELARKNGEPAGWEYRMPLESEWECACRGGPGQSKDVYGSDFYLDSAYAGINNGQANFAQIWKRPARVGFYRPNRLGLYDMHGNVWEWCLGADGTPYLVGGAYNDPIAANLRAASRIKKDPDYKLHDVGFRVARVAVAAAGSTKKFTNSLGMDFALVPRGKAWLGGFPNKEGTMEFELRHDIYFGTHEVTQGQWKSLMGDNPSTCRRDGKNADAVKDIADADLDQLPVDSVSWDDCQKFLKALNDKTKEEGWVYRLPTEAEWEYACRGGPMKSKEESAADKYFEKVNANSKGPVKVGSYIPTRLGLFDMQGNVWEWCHGDASKPLRGGGWAGTWGQTANGRRGVPSGTRAVDFGLRVARIPQAMLPLDAAWIEKTVNLPTPAQQMDAVKAKLIERNPDADISKIAWNSYQDGSISGMFIHHNVVDIAPLAAIPTLRSLDWVFPDDGTFVGFTAVDLSPLKNTSLKTLTCRGVPIKSLAPLKNMKLETLSITGTLVADLTPLKSMPLKKLLCGKTKVSDLTPLAGMALENLDIAGTEVTDLSILKGMPLQTLICDDALVYANAKELRAAASMRPGPPLRINGRNWMLYFEKTPKK